RHRPDAEQRERLSPRAPGILAARFAPGHGALRADGVRAPGRGPQVKLGAYALTLALVAGAAQAQAPETLAWLRKMQDAAQKLSYTGTFVYQNAGRSETSRITRFVEAGGDIEKLEVMDGVPREIVRTKDTVRCYLPGARLVKVDRRTERGFPALLPERIAAVARNYDISL